MRTLARWVGAAVCLAIAALWAANYWWTISATGFARSGRQWRVGFAYGRFVYSSWPALPPLQRAVWSWDCMSNDGGYMLWRPHWSETSGKRMRVLPLWMAFMSVSLPTAWLWRRDHRGTAGHCPCGYDLTGLARPTLCPECGHTQRGAR